MTLIVDPLDGTAEYLAGSPHYSICIALARDGEVLVAIVLFPAKDTLYCLSPKGVRRAKPVFEVGAIRLCQFEMKSNPTSDLVYHNSRVPAAILAHLSASGFRPAVDTTIAGGAPSAILEVGFGRALAYLAHTRQMRDLLLAPILGGHPEFTVSDWEGLPLRWPDGGRVPRVLIASSGAVSRIAQLLISSSRS